jgi:hypothetical protein
MKNLLVIAFVFITSGLFAQNENFNLEKDAIIWRYVFNDTNSIKLLKDKSKLEFKTDSTGIIKKSLLNHKKTTDEFTAEFKIESKKDRYRVTVTNIRFFSSRQINFEGIMTSMTDYPLEMHWIKNNKIIEKLGGVNITELFNDFFVDLFTIPKQKTDEDW